MTEHKASDLRSAFETIRQQVEAIRFGADVALKDELLAVYRNLDTSIAELTSLKEEMRGFVERWKVAQTGGERSVDLAPERENTPVGYVPPFVPGTPVPHEDHLGASTYLEKGWTKISFGDYAGAEEALMRALELSPTNTEGQSLLGWAQMLQDKLDAALLNFQYVLSRDPSNPLARLNVGYICLKKGIFGEAIEHLSKALRQDDDARAKLYANFYLGLVYAEREMYEDAQGFFEQSIALGPNLVEAYFELGHAYWLAGNTIRARETWQEGAEVNKYNPWSTQCAEILQLLDSGGTPRRLGLSNGSVSEAAVN